MKKFILLFLFFVNYGLSESVEVGKNEDKKIITAQLVEKAKIALGTVVLAMVTYNNVGYNFCYKTYFYLYNLLWSWQDSSLKCRTIIDSDDFYIMYTSYFFIKDGLKNLKKLQKASLTIDEKTVAKLKNDPSKTPKYLKMLNHTILPILNIAVGLGCIEFAGDGIMQTLNKSYSYSIIPGTLVPLGQFLIGQYMLRDGIKKLIKQYTKKEKQQKKNSSAQA